MTPKGRRLHLIQSHGYPKQFFFSVTNKGIGGLLHKWGQGASLYRGNWRSRDQVRDMERGSENEDEIRSESGTGSEMDVEEIGQHKVNGKRGPPHKTGRGDDILDNTIEIMSGPSTILSPSSARPRAAGSSEADILANAMSSLTLVPDKIRFGRGGKRVGLGIRIRQSRHKQGGPYIPSWCKITSTRKLVARSFSKDMVEGDDVLLNARRAMGQAVYPGTLMLFLSKDPSKFFR
ncbi:hypothetical protein JB92DRAFT_1611825 [Gautieria morchelliformis]|nr:hypothetical protein JB92DRAFT_1611825 [Gautieria morchelliformis]